jgi:hypothetical protein
MFYRTIPLPNFMKIISAILHVLQDTDITELKDWHFLTTVLRKQAKTNGNIHSALIRAYEGDEDFSCCSFMCL